MKRRNIFWILSAFTVSILIWACRKESSPVNEETIQIDKLISWLKDNGGNIKSGTIQLADQTGKLQAASLNWAGMQVIDADEAKFYKVPFGSTSSQSSSQNLLKSESTSDIKSEKYFLVFQEKKSSGFTYEVRVAVETVADVKDHDGKKLTAALGTFFDLAGKKKSLWIAQNGFNNYKRLYEKKAKSNLSSNSIGSNGTGLCAYFNVPIYDYVCSVGNQTGNYDVTCGYVKTGYGEQSMCADDGISGPGTSVISDPFNYNIYFGGGGGTNDNKDIRDKIDKYPCAKSVLDSALNLNDTLSKLLKSIFNVDASVNIKFVDDDRLIGGNTDAYTLSSGTPDFFSSTIRMNPFVLTNSSKEYMAATFMHEAIHSYIDYYFNMYLQGVIDSVSFKSKFPIFWILNPTANLNANELQQHQEMANRYVHLMKQFLARYNPDIPDDVAEALAWGGLHKTTLWKTKSDTTSIHNINFYARDIISNQSVLSNAQLKRCP